MIVKVPRESRGRNPETRETSLQGEEEEVDQFRKMFLGTHPRTPWTRMGVVPGIGCTVGIPGRLSSLILRKYSMVGH